MPKYTIEELLNKKTELNTEEIGRLIDKRDELWDFITSQMREGKNELGNLVGIELKLEAESNQ